MGIIGHELPVPVTNKLMTGPVNYDSLCHYFNIIVFIYFYSYVFIQEFIGQSSIPNASGSKRGTSCLPGIIY
jgi:hypothetical protein